MRTAIRITWMMITGIVVGQKRPEGQVKVLTVCEVLGNLPRYADTVVAVVGRLERSVSLIDRYDFLSQDRCEHPVIAHGHVWSDKIQLWAGWEAGMPKPPSDRPKLGQSVIAAKLSIVRTTTEVGSHQEPQFKTEGRSVVYTHMAEVSNESAIVYGRIVKVPGLNENCGAKGCGGDNVPLLIIAEPYNIHELRNDGTRCLRKSDHSLIRVVKRNPFQAPYRLSRIPNVYSNPGNLLPRREQLHRMDRIRFGHSFGTVKNSGVRPLSPVFTQRLRLRSTLQIVAVKEGRNQTKRAGNRRRPLNRKIIASNISEARDELNKLLAKIDAGPLHEAELQVGLLHAHHHLNFAWNIRRVATSRYASLTQREFGTWEKYPSDIESFGE